MKGESRAKRKQSFQVRALPSRLLSYQKIVKGESRDRRKRSFQVRALPSRLLSYQKIVKGESRAKRKQSFQVRALPSRLLSYQKIVKGESRDRRKRSFQVQALPSRSLSYQKIVNREIEISPGRSSYATTQTVPLLPQKIERDRYPGCIYNRENRQTASCPALRMIDLEACTAPPSPGKVTGGEAGQIHMQNLCRGAKPSIYLVAIFGR